MLGNSSRTPFSQSSRVTPFGQYTTDTPSEATFSQFPYSLSKKTMSSYSMPVSMRIRSKCFVFASNDISTGPSPMMSAKDGVVTVVVVASSPPSRFTVVILNFSNNSLAQFGSSVRLLIPMHTFSKHGCAHKSSKTDRTSARSLTRWLPLVKRTPLLSGSSRKGDPLPSIKYRISYISGVHKHPSRSKMMALGKRDCLCGSDLFFWSPLLELAPACNLDGNGVRCHPCAAEARTAKLWRSWIVPGIVRAAGTPTFSRDPKASVLSNAAPKRTATVTAKGVMVFIAFGTYNMHGTKSCSNFYPLSELAKSEDSYDSVRGCFSVLFRQNEDDCRTLVV
mmetsp:Transcript_119169/g.243705  ORF Transcript_119169/g.243705 Transcript_119169/m.243705 type:complete len:336 (-) Transcript_119169:38-1045(-)